jgi:hypothetical protein
MAKLIQFEISYSVMRRESENRSEVACFWDVEFLGRRDVVEWLQIGA